MKPSFEKLKKLCPDVPDEFVREHLERLDENYFAVFTVAQAGAHIQGLAGLSAGKPVEVLFEEGQGNKAACTVLAYDYPSEFSLITGVLSATGFNIISGGVFTYRHAVAGRRRMIIDRFSGALPSDATAEDWKARFKSALAEVIARLEQGTGDSVSSARGMVNEMVAARLAKLKLPSESVLYPVGIEVSNAGGYTRLSVLSQDTPAFLYALSSALALQGLSIEQVRISTKAGRVRDEIDILDSRGAKITEAPRLDAIKLSVLLTKQFTYFLSSAPDPSLALFRFEDIVQSVISVPERREWVKLLSSPDALHGLARLLGASDYVWEDFIRLQYETLLPMFNSSGPARRFAAPANELERELDALLSGTDGFERKCRALNEFKDRQLYLLDLDQIMDTDMDVKQFSKSLTALAELVVRRAAGIVFERLQGQYGKPRAVAGLEAHWAICGLGKFGGAAIGYASDIELLLVFSDNGQTDGREAIGNSEYFSQAARLLTEVIKAKREGIFHVDIRLRPYGESGPAACSLESFCRYYGPGGPAHSYEILALTRLRAVAGDPALGARIERLRDDFVYGGGRVRLEELKDLREKQVALKTVSGRYNAKFSPGALVDLEYDIQLLQAMHGHQDERLRTPRIHEALEALAALGVLSPGEGRSLEVAYYFFRRLINGLRMLRGSARDLFLPPDGSLEFAHLARRMGYRRGEPLEPEQQLRVDFETQSAVVRAFIERHFGRESLPGKPDGNAADIVLSDSMPPTLRAKILARIGFADTARAYRNLRQIAQCAGGGTEFAALSVLAADALRQSVDADRALNNWERFVRAAGSAREHFDLMLAQPKRLEILLDIFAASQFLSDTLIRNPEFLVWVTAPEIIAGVRTREKIESDLRAFTSGMDHAGWMNGIRRFRCREILRIGARDICLHAPIKEVTADLSHLAEAIIREAFLRYFSEPDPGRGGGRGAPSPESLCIAAFGKLGGRELNYSSDIDLLGIYDPGDGTVGEDAFTRAVKTIGSWLSGHTAEGHVYRVDFRLRPYGRAGQLACSLPALRDYYRDKAAAWEVQALLKARPVAGGEELGRQFLAMAAGIICACKAPGNAAESAAAMRKRDIFRRPKGVTSEADIKNGPGGIRDIEFLVQGLQLATAVGNPAIINGNTLEALELLGKHGVMGPNEVAALERDYAFLRRIEHCLQIFEDRQVHKLPGPGEELKALAKRVMGAGGSESAFQEELNACRARVRAAFTRVFPGHEKL